MRIVHVVPSFHDAVASLDTPQESLPRALGLLLAALEVLRREPASTFVVEQVLLLEAFVTRYPDHLPELRALAAAGRLEVACGMLVVPDANMPSGESLIRQAVTGQRWLRSRLGVQATTCWLADCWGHPASLPGLLRHCGYTRFIFWRGKPPWLTSSEFTWRGLDGSTVLGHWTPAGFSTVRFPEAAPTAPGDEQEALPAALHGLIEETAAFAATPHLFLANGGAATLPRPTTVPALAAPTAEAADSSRFACSTPDRFFRAIEAVADQLPVYEGEFNPVCQGTYSSRVALKQLNRRLESALAAAERANVLLWLDGGDYPTAPFEEVWRRTLINQSHDLISGTSVDAAYDVAVAQYREADRLVTRLLMDAVDRAMARRVGQHGGMGLFVFNPLPRPRREVLRLNTVAIGWSSYRVLDPEGRDVPVQLGEKELLVLADLPPLGYATFALRTGATEPPGASPVRSQAAVATAEGGKPAEPAAAEASDPAVRQLETEQFHLRLRGGVITSLVDHATGREYVDPERPFWNDLVLEYDNGDLWLINEAPLNDTLRTVTPRPDPYPTTSSPGDPTYHSGILAHTAEVTSELVEQGPLRTTIRSRGILRYGTIRVEFVQHVSIYQQLRRIDFRTELTGRGKQYRLRAAFPTPWRAGRIVHAVSCGHMERPPGEYPSQGWFGLEADSAAVYLCNRGLPGANVTDGILMLSLQRSVAMEYQGASSKAYEDGVAHTFSYSVLPATGPDAEPWWEAEALNMPPFTIAAADVGPRLEPRLEIGPGNVVLSALYRDEGVLTARLYETAGVACEAELWFAGMTACRTTDALNAEGVPLAVHDQRIRLPLGPFQVRTLRLEARRAAADPAAPFARRPARR